jgi:hypothetical protein
MFRPKLHWLLILLIPGVVWGQEYSFDLESFEKKPFQIGGYAEFKHTSQSLNDSSLLAPLAVASERFRLGTLELNADYSWDKTRLSGVLHSQWFDDDFGEQHSTDLYQGYLNHQFNDRLSIDLGKRTLRWGKGYAWNPVAFVERLKDPLDPDLSREGFVIASADYIRSFEGDLKTLAFSPVILPVSDDVNEDFGKNSSNFAAKLYMLYRDIDIDLLYRSNGSRPARIGMDFSANLATNFEVHGEWSHGEYTRAVLVANKVVPQQGTANNVLLGMRYLNEMDTTYILEYYHNGEGYTDDEMKDYYQFISSLGTTQKQARTVSQSGYSLRQNMRDYLYLRVNQKEPFDILYLTPGVTLIYNLHDDSYSLSPDLVYTRIDNLELRLRATLLKGDTESEFGGKLTEAKLEFRVRYTF